MWRSASGALDRNRFDLKSSKNSHIGITGIRCSAAQPDKTYGVFIEVDKILIDAHNSVHRVAFNKAFQVWQWLVASKWAFELPMQASFI